MTIRTRFKITVLLTALLMLMGVACVGFGMWQTHDSIKKAVAMGNLVDSLHELRDIGLDYRLDPIDRAKEQWQAYYEDIRLRIDANSDIPGNVHEATDNLKAVFDGIVASDKDGHTGAMRQRRLNQQYLYLDIESQRIHDWATTIRDKARNSFFTGSRYYNTGIVAILILITIISTTVITRVGRRVLNSLQILEQGANSLAEENTGQQLDTDGVDEISRLTGAFNTMSRALYANHKELRLQAIVLEEEIAERQRTQEALLKKTNLLEEQTVILEAEIAERMHIQEEHDLLEEQLRQSQKMEAIGLLAGGVAHDFNNILTVIMGYGSMLIAHLPEGAERDSAAQILKASERAVELTRGLLAFSSRQTLNLYRTDINQLGADNGKFLKRVIGEDIELVMTYHPTPLYILIDRSQIQQVFMNLATNARDAMPSGGKLAISISSEILNDDFISLQGYGNSGDHAVIQVSDVGPGMDKETVERIFEPFFTTKEIGKGTGLGLSIIHGIIAQHNGFIHCSSQPGQGTTFTIHLPLCVEQEHIDTPVVEIEMCSLCGTETILLAEDDDMLMEMTTNHLESNGYTVLQAYDGAEAVEIFAKHQYEIDLVILDAIMPKMTGKQAWNEISSLKPGVKACFVSGYTNEIISGKLAIDFSLPFISKPVMPETLLRKVREILDGERRGQQ